MVDSVTKVYSAVADADKANAAALQQLQNQVIALNQHYLTQAAQAEQTKTAAEGAANAQLAQNGQSPLPQMPVALVSREYVGPSAAPVNFDDILKMGAQGLANDGFTATGGGDPTAGMFTWNPNYSEGRISGDLGAVTGYLKDVGNGSKKEKDYQTGTLSGSLAFRDERKVDRLAPAGHLKGTPMNHLQLDLLRPGQPVKYKKYDYEFDIMDDGSGTAEQQNAIQKSTPVISSQSDTGTAGDSKHAELPTNPRERVKLSELPPDVQNAVRHALIFSKTRGRTTETAVPANLNMNPTTLGELETALAEAPVHLAISILMNATLTRVEWYSLVQGSNFVNNQLDDWMTRQREEYEAAVKSHEDSIRDAGIKNAIKWDYIGHAMGIPGGFSNTYDFRMGFLQGWQQQQDKLQSLGYLTGDPHLAGLFVLYSEPFFSISDLVTVPLAGDLVAQKIASDWDKLDKTTSGSDLYKMWLMASKYSGVASAAEIWYGVDMIEGRALTEEEYYQRASDVVFVATGTIVSVALAPATAARIVSVAQALNNAVGRAPKFAASLARGIGPVNVRALSNTTRAATIPDLMFGDLTAGAKRLVRELSEKGSVGIKSGARLDDIRQASMFLGREVAVVSGPKGMRALVGTADGIPSNLIRPGEKFLVHTHPVYVSKADHFLLDIRNAEIHVEAVIDWGGNITFFNNRGIIQPTLGPINPAGFVIDFLIGYF